ncbi:FkbM family methyltransferase [Nisaea sp.]|uniref:FkbM family methyltransferase n=1 Tax=Nisaea sp. TaxID=2024842 RepID=UPI0032ED2D51
MSTSSLNLLEDAESRYREGFHSSAARLCRRVPKGDPCRLRALVLLGSICLEAGKAAEAADSLSEAATLAPISAGAWTTLGTAFERTRRPAQAAASYRRAVLLDPGTGEADRALARNALSPGRPGLLKRLTFLSPLSSAIRFDYGAYLKQAGETPRATDQFRRMLLISPAHRDGIFLFANLLMDAGDVDGAKKFFARTLRIAPRSGAARNNLGLIAFNDDDFERAEEWFSAATVAAPGLPEAWLNHARALQKLQRDADAIQPCRRGLLIDPANQTACCDIAGLLQAARWARRAIALDLDAAGPYGQLAVSATRAPGRRGTETWLRRGAIVEPGNPETWFRLCTEAGLASDPEKQVTYGIRTTLISDSQAQARNNTAFALLGLEKFEPGWKLHRRRLETAEGRKIQRHFAVPEWTGEAIGDRHLLLWGEQGIGDEVQFLMLLKHMERRCAQLTIIAEPRLRPLIKRSFPDIGVPDVDSATGDVEDHHGADMHLAIGDLPDRLALFCGGQATPEPWLVPDQDRVMSLRAKLSFRHPGKRLVGITWRSEAPKTGQRRTIAPEAWRRIAMVQGVALVSLQYSVRAEDLAAFEAAGIAIDADHGIDPVQDLDGLAALVAAMDLVIAPPNNTVHIAGALEVPCRVLLPTRPDWRWGLTRRDSLWYPNTRVYRQETDGDWGPVIDAAARDLAASQAATTMFGNDPVSPAQASPGGALPEPPGQTDPVNQRPEAPGGLILSEELSGFYHRVRSGGSNEAECIRVIEDSLAAGNHAEALYIIESALQILPPSESLQDMACALIEDIDTRFGTESFIVQLLDGPGGLARMHAELTEKFTPIHGDKAPRPANPSFLKSVILKGMCMRIGEDAPIRYVLSRFSEHFARRSAEPIFGKPVRSIVTNANMAKVQLAGRELLFHVPNLSTRWRFRNFFLHEPGLLRMISHFRDEDVFLDIGANIGSFSIAAAVTRRCRTFSIEPFSANYEQLLRNIALNKVGDLVTPLNIALSDKTEAGRLSLSSNEIGSATHAFDAASAPQTPGTGSGQAVQGYRLDDLISGGQIDFPTHVKIDVDGLEHRIIAGMPKTLADSRLRSIRMEVDLSDPENVAAVKTIEEAGFTCRIDDDPKNLLCLREQKWRLVQDR